VLAGKLFAGRKEKNFSQNNQSVAEIRPKHLLTTSLNSYHYINLFGGTYVPPINKYIKWTRDSEVSSPKQLSEFWLNLILWRTRLRIVYQILVLANRYRFNIALNLHENQSDFIRLFFSYCGGVRPSSLGTSATVGLLYQPRMIDDDDYGAVAGMRIGRGNRSTRRKPAPVPLCPPQILHDLT
jgi:hypothetical protein